MLSRVIWAARIDMQIALFATLFPLLFGTPGRRPGRLLRRLARRAVRPHRRPRHHLSLPGDRHRHRRGARAGPDQHVHRGQRRRLGVLRPADAGRGPGRRSRATMPPPAACSAMATPRIIFRHLLPNAITPIIVYLDDRHGARHPARLEPRLSRPRRPAADGRMGRADRRRQELHDHRLVDLGLSRHRHRARRRSASAWSATASPTCCGAAVSDAPAADRGAGIALAIRGLAIDVRDARRPGRAVDGVDLEVGAGEVLGLVGESGSGKSVTLRSIVRLVRPPRPRRAAQVLWRGRDLLRAAGARSCATCAAARSRMIFQEPMTALNPVLTVGEQIRENLQAHTGLDARRARARAPSSCSTWSASRRPSAHRRLSAPVLRRHAPARDDRHRARRQPEAAAGRRADHRARRHHPGPDPEAASCACATRARHERRPGDPRSRRDRPDLRPASRSCMPAASSRSAPVAELLRASRATPIRWACSTRCRAAAPCASRCARSPARRRRSRDLPPGCAFAPRCRLRDRRLPPGGRPPLVEVGADASLAPACTTTRSRGRRAMSAAAPPLLEVAGLRQALRAAPAAARRRCSGAPRRLVAP